MSTSDGNSKKSLVSMLNMSIFLPAATPLVILIILGFIYKDELAAPIGVVLSWTLENFGWFYTMGSTFLLAVTLWACFSKYGKIKLGGPDAKPEMSFITWFGIALTSGIAIGICFFGVAEPMTHYLSPPPPSAAWKANQFWPANRPFATLTSTGPFTPMAVIQASPCA